MSLYSRCINKGPAWSEKRLCSNLQRVLIAERNRRQENCKLVANLLIHPEVDDRVAAGVGQGQPQEDSVDIAHSSGGQGGQRPKQ